MPRLVLSARFGSVPTEMGRMSYFSVAPGGGVKPSASVSLLLV